MRASNGTLRTEVRYIVQGVPEKQPSQITLSDVVERRSFSFDTARKIASFTPDFMDPEEQYNSSLGGAQKVSRTLVGVPCSEIQSVFQEDGVIVSRGSVCRAIGYGIVIYERAAVPSKGKRMLHWETDLVDFKPHTEPPKELMEVPRDYQRVAVPRTTPQ